MSSILRVQHPIDGRGPYRPGFTQKWRVEDDYPVLPLSTAQLASTVTEWPQGMHVACGCRSLEQLALWFSPKERRNLEALGFRVVNAPYDVVIAQDDYQVIVGRRRPWRLSPLTTIAWSRLR